MRVNAFPFDKIIGKFSDLPIVNDINAHENSNKFHTVLLKIYYAIYIKDIKLAILSPKQAREYRTIIDGTLHHLDHTVTGTFTITYGD